jgi:hypothetical protein
MTLAELLESKFRGDVRFRGDAYLSAERVSIIRVTPEHVFGVVRDGVDFQTQLSRQEAGLKLACTCGMTPAPQGGNIHCKHVWGTILAVDGGNYLTGSVKPGNIPPFSVDAEPLDLGLDNDWDLDEAGEEPQRRLTPPRARKAREKESEVEAGRCRTMTPATRPPVANAR